MRSHFTRRQLFQVGNVSIAGYFLDSVFRPVNVSAKAKVRPRGNADFCIFVNLSGGASHVDTFDIKEHRWTPPDFDIRTVKPGLRLPSGLFPKLTAGIDRLAIVRSMKAWENEHIRAQFYLQVAHSPSPSRLKEMPSIGSVIASEFQTRRREMDYLPPFVAMNFTSGAFKVIGEGCLDSGNAPLSLETDAGFDFVIAPEEQARFRRRWEVLKQLERSGPDAGRYQEEFQAHYRGAHAMMVSPDIRKVLTLDADDRRRYGSSQVGDACALARNLVGAGAGTRFIMVSHKGWDTHVDIYGKNAQYKLAHELDNALSALLDDLESAKLLGRTLVCCTGEFGRTPGELTVNKGRDHFKDAFTGLFAGAGVQGGRAIGTTDDLGTRITDPGWHRKRPVYFEDVAATIYSALGIDWTKSITQTPSGRVFEYIENQSGTEFFEPDEISELFGA